MSAAAPCYVVRLLEQGEVNGQCYELLENLPEGSLQQRLARGHLTAGQVRALVEEINAALVFLHQRDIVHGDIDAEIAVIESCEFVIDRRSIPAERCSDACKQLLDTERLGNIVVGAKIERASNAK